MSHKEQEFFKTTGEAMLLLQKYKLKTNLLGCNMEKSEFNYYYELYADKTHNRLNKIVHKMQSIVKILRKNILFCEVGELKAMNNSIRGYRRRVGQLTQFQPTKYSYALFEKEEEILYNITLRSDTEALQQAKIIHEKIKRQQEACMKNLEERQSTHSNKFKTPYAKILDIIDQTQAACSRLYDNFERSMYLTMNSVHSNFDKFSIYLDKWETMCSTKAYAAKTHREEEFDRRIAQKSNLLNKSEEETIQQLTVAMKKCLPFSPLTEDYQRRIQQIKRMSEQRKKKLNRAGVMSNKRRNKKGILKGVQRHINVVDWYGNFDGNKVPLLTRPKPQTYGKKEHQPHSMMHDQHSFLVHQLYNQQKEKEEKVKLTRQQLAQQYVPAGICGSFWIDHARKVSPIVKLVLGNHQNNNGEPFDLQDFPNAILQRRVQFENDMQMYLQEMDQKRRIQAAEQERKLEREDRPGYFTMQVGYKHLTEMDELQYLFNKQYSSEFLPVKLPEEQPQSERLTRERSLKPSPKQTILPQKTPKSKSNQNQSDIVICEWMRGQSNQAKPIKQNRQTPPQLEQFFTEQERPKTQLEQITNIFFKQIERKSKRQTSIDMLSKAVTFIYFPSTQQIDVKQVQQLNSSLRIFVVCENAIVLMEKFHGYQSVGKIKVALLIFNQVDTEEQIKKIITKLYPGSMFNFTIWRLSNAQKEQRLLAIQIGAVIKYSKDRQTAADASQEQLAQQGNPIIRDFEDFFKQNLNPNS